MLILLNMADEDTCVDTILHFWYSCRLREAHVRVLQSEVRPLIAEMVQKISSKGEKVLLAKNFKLSNLELRIVLKKGQWQELLRTLDRSTDPAIAETSRKDITLQRRDLIDHQLLQICRHLHRREAKLQFRQRGMLLPFGASDSAFTQPNR